MIRVLSFADADARRKQADRIETLIALALATGVKPRLSIRAATARRPIITRRKS